MRIKNILQYLERTASRVPEKTAFSQGGQGESLTFGALLELSRRVGSELCRQGMTGRRVAVWMDRCPMAIAVMLGAVYAGACYVPLDASMPRERVTHILSSAKVALLLCDRTNIDAARQSGCPVCPVDELLSADADETALSVVRAAQIDTDPIYMIFTSGSTGLPKGVVGCHRAVIDYGEALTAALGLDETRVFGCQSPLYFDAPLKEILTTLMYGATTYLIPRRLFSFPTLLLEYLKENGINTVCWVSSALHAVATLGALEQQAPTTLDKVVFGSEVLPMKSFHAWRAALPRAEFFQLYGPTEATGMSCYYRVDRDFGEGERIPIGRPLDNTGLFLLGADGDPILPHAGSRSEQGEICLRGSCLTLGYDHDERTSISFVQNPLHNAYPETVYRTGDIACYNERGELEFLGRRDSQIKRMGHRIELGEIEAQSLACAGVTAAACVACEQDGEMVLFYTGETDGASLRQQLEKRLPRYYMPRRICRRTELPLTENGKIDRRALGKEAGEE